MTLTLVGSGLRSDMGNRRCFVFVGKCQQCRQGNFYENHCQKGECLSDVTTAGRPMV